jgi:hypothetical protein
VSLPCSIVELRVYDRDGTTLRDTIGATGCSFTDPLGEIGSASLSVPLVQAVMAADPALLTNGIIKVATNLTGTSTLTEVFGFLSEGGTLTLISDAEDAGKERALQCRGLLALLDDWVVYPETGIHAHSADQRTFGWMSKASDRWFDETQWTGSIRATKWKDIGSGADRYHRPRGWQDPNASWVDAGNNKEKQYFRTTVTVDADTPVKVFASADERLEVYLDSELIISSDAEEIGYLDLNYWRGILTAGTHTFGVKYVKDLLRLFGDSWITDAIADTYDRMIFTCMSIRPNGDPVGVLRHSNDSAHWLAVGLDDGVRPPTWTAGGIMGQLIREARLRDVDSADRVTIGWTDTDDSDSTAWADLHERQWPVGTRGSKVMQDLGEHDIDFDMLPDLTLNAYKHQGSDLSATVGIVKGGDTFGSITPNITRYTATHTPSLATTLLIRSHNRWVQRTESAAESGGDRKEWFLETGGSLSREQARHHGDAALNDLAYDRYTYTAEIIAVTGCVPYQDFGKGDTIRAYDVNLDPMDLRVVSISGSADGGPIRWTLELEEP